MPKLVIRKDRCKSCRICVQTCTRECLYISSEINQEGYLVVALKDEDRCTGCGLCAEMCPDLVIEVYR